LLSALDAKIALNHRINVELEGMAKLLYDYWFVQYDFPLSAAQAAALGKPDLTGQPYRSSGGPMVFDPQLKREPQTFPSRTPAPRSSRPPAPVEKARRLRAESTRELCKKTPHGARPMLRARAHVL
jgi:hypothetical protein